MVPGKYDITVMRGATYESGDISRSVNGVALNFAAYSSMTLKIKTAWKHTETTDVEDAILTLTLAGGHIVVADDELSISIVIPASETLALTFEAARYFLYLHKTVSDVPVTHSLLYGKFTVIGEDDI